mmetsp:Transcript_61897/g.136049  ORF Transcript_61897/g.136049 Transcript_61897/m.136049 type:complete len:558 (+) Transcript_61897:111-1784(+)|eukprot:CAMPEP_0180421710 /NCGR_PEP_ID=MMETSP1036_2-20121128/3293_1 /TAXON_ID=632150 /ORGANISM="Azadinium spinosum, Strain 3D9" /LENGTH=557 /DNA_ID=CAMNT_0022426987 /DNA_START=18 /DNA_END=1691 /DNA_ORIENTATION=+
MAAPEAGRRVLSDQQRLDDGPPALGKEEPDSDAELGWVTETAMDTVGATASMVYTAAETSTGAVVSLGVGMVSAASVMGAAMAGVGSTAVDAVMGKEEVHVLKTELSDAWGRGQEWNDGTDEWEHPGEKGSVANGKEAQGDLPDRERPAAATEADGCCACTAGLRSWLFRRDNADTRARQAPAVAKSQRKSHAELQVAREAARRAEDIPAADCTLEPSSPAFMKSAELMKQHCAKAPWTPTVLLYDASPDPPPQQAPNSSRNRRRSRRAYHMPLNSRQPSRVENENFIGSFMFLHRDPQPSDPVERSNSSSSDAVSYGWHFGNKTRRWEARVQGRFRNRPKGPLFTGCVLEDFDYTTEQSWAATTLQMMFLPLIEAVLGEKMYFAWGSRGEEAEEADSELATVVTGLPGVDQVIVTPAGEPVPAINSDISAMGLRRNAMSASSYRRQVAALAKSINTEDTYTFCVWGCSRYIDVLTSSFVGVMGLGAWSYAEFLDEWPAHFILYSLEEDATDPRHLERRKQYFIDVMVWSSNMSLPKLPSRYAFRDHRLHHEAELAE